MLGSKMLPSLSVIGVLSLPASAELIKPDIGINEGNRLPIEFALS